MACNYGDRNGDLRWNGELYVDIKNQKCHWERYFFGELDNQTYYSVDDVPYAITAWSGQINYKDGTTKQVWIDFTCNGIEEVYLGGVMRYIASYIVLEPRIVFESPFNNPIVSIEDNSGIYKVPMLEVSSTAKTITAKNISEIKGEGAIMSPEDSMFDDSIVGYNDESWEPNEEITFIQSSIGHYEIVPNSTYYVFIYNTNGVSCVEIKTNSSNDNEIYVKVNGKYVIGQAYKKTSLGYVPCKLYFKNGNVYTEIK